MRSDGSFQQRRPERPPFKEPSGEINVRPIVSASFPTITTRGGGGRLNVHGTVRCPSERKHFPVRDATRTLRRRGRPARRSERLGQTLLNGGGGVSRRQQTVPVPTVPPRARRLPSSTITADCCDRSPRLPARAHALAHVCRQRFHSAAESSLAGANPPRTS